MGTYTPSLKNDKLKNMADQAYELYQQKNYPDDAVLMEKALEPAEDLFGKDHPKVTQFINNLGLLYRSQGRYDEAERLKKTDED